MNNIPPDPITKHIDNYFRSDNNVRWVRLDYVVSCFDSDEATIRELKEKVELLGDFVEMLNGKLDSNCKNELNDEDVGETLEALRYNTNKPEMMYILSFPKAIEEFTNVCTYGGKKYDVGNYLKGAPLSQYVNCGLRHLFKWWNGEDRDPESGCLHLAHFVWNALCLCEIALTQTKRDDRFNQETVKDGS